MKCTFRARPLSRHPRSCYEPQVWEEHKDVIKQLYLDERRPLRDVMTVMAQKHGFQAT